MNRHMIPKTAAAVNIHPVVTTIPADLLTPLAVYLKLAADGADSFLLESVEGGRNLARYSFIGAGPSSTVRAVTTPSKSLRSSA